MQAAVAGAGMVQVIEEAGAVLLCHKAGKMRRMLKTHIPAAGDHEDQAASRAA